MLGKAVRRLGRGDQARLQEEMAWQLAEMFVKDVTRYILTDRLAERFWIQSEINRIDWTEDLNVF